MLAGGFCFFITRRVIRALSGSQRFDTCRLLQMYGLVVSLLKVVKVNIGVILGLQPRDAGASSV